MKAVLVQPFCFSKLVSGPVYSLGTGYIGSSIKRQCKKIFIYDFNLYKKSEKHLWTEIINNLEDINYLGISITAIPKYESFFNLLEVLKYIKKLYPKIVIFIGGIAIADKLSNLEKCDFIDHIFIGESDNTVSDILQSGSQDKIHFSKDAIDVTKLDFPIFPNNISNAVSIQSSRGCNNNCTFCTIPSRRWVARSEDSIDAEIERYIAHVKDEAKFLYFIDENMVGNNGKRINNIANIIYNKYPYIEWAMSFSTNSDILNLDLDLLKRSKLNNVFIGIESINKSALKRYNKTFNLNKSKKIIKFFRDANINVSIGYIPFDFWTSLDEVIESIKFIIDFEFFDFINNFYEQLIPFSTSKLGKRFSEEVFDNDYFLYEALVETDYNYFQKDLKVELAKRLFSDLMDLGNKFSNKPHNKINSKCIKNIMTDYLAILSMLKTPNGYKRINKLYFNLINKLKHMEM